MADPDTGATPSFLYATTMVGTATDVALAELTLQGFLAGRCGHPCRTPGRGHGKEG
jgi:hypothetical protein